LSDGKVINMSIKTALDNIYLNPASRWGHTEYSLDYHKDYLARSTKLAVDDTQLIRSAHKIFEFDLNWSSNDGIIDWESSGRVTNMGHASYAANGSDQRDSAESPFKSVDEVWEFDAVTEYGLPSFNEQVDAYEKQIQQQRKIYPNS
jgi:hypothetical protein